MRRRKLLVVLAGLAVVGAALAGKMLALELRARPDRITRENLARIKEGMSRGEVEAILGPPGDYSSGPVDFAGSGRSRPPDELVFTPGRREAFEDKTWERFEWRNDRRIVWIYFEPSGKVLSESDSMVQRIDQSLSESVFWRAKREWRRWFP
jgi:hypothetical protein